MNTLERLAHLPEKNREAVDGFARALIESLGDNLVSIILFGSAAGGEFVPGKSDINTLVKLRRAKAADLDVIMREGKKYAKGGISVPLVFEEGHIASSLDTFPIEFSDMKRRHILLHGVDPLENAAIEGRNLRYQCEREFKSMLVNLRRGYLRTEGKKENIRGLLEGSLSSVLAACRGMIWLSGKTPSDDTGALLKELAEIYKVEAGAIGRVWQLRKEKDGGGASLQAIFDDYLENLDQLAAVADKL